MISIALSSPKHPFVVFSPPKDYKDLASTKRVARFWWDTQSKAVEIQYFHRGKWKDLATVYSGYTSKALAIDTVFRLRDVDEEKWSQPFQGSTLINPGNLARISSDNNGLTSQTIGELSLDGSNTLWGATLGGGLLQLDTQSLEINHLTSFDGLPSPYVISIDTEDDKVLVGTSEGAVLFENGHPIQYWDAELPNRYVQSVKLDGETNWLGTYEGLYAETKDAFYTPLVPYSVFSIEPKHDGGTYIGYQGLKIINPDFSPEDLLNSDSFHAYDIIDAGTSVYFATKEKGVQRLDGEEWTLIQNLKSTQIDLGLNGLWMATGKNGLVHSSGHRLSTSDGLAGNTVWSVTSQGQNLWVGTDGGISRLSLNDDGQVHKSWSHPIVSWPVERKALDLLALKDGIFLGGPTGTWSLGAPHRYANNLSIAAPKPTVALLEHNKYVWAFGENTVVKMDKKGQLERFNLPTVPKSVALWQDRFWIATSSGIWVLDPDNGLFQVSHPDIVMDQLIPSPSGLWGFDSRGIFYGIGPKFPKPIVETGHVLDLSPSGESICIGTESGLERYWMARSDKLEDVLGDGDTGIAVVAVAGDDLGGCWFAGEDGTIGWVGPTGAATKTELPGLKTPTVIKIIPITEKQAWVLTNKGTWRILLDE